MLRFESVEGRAVPEDAERIMEWLVGNAHGAVAAGAVTEVSIIVEIVQPVEILVRIAG